MTTFNIASLLSEAANRWPERLAVIAPHRPDVLGRGQMSYRELDESSSKLAARLLREGAMPGSRAITLAKPGLDFFTIIFGLFKAALVPVMVDPGMGLSRMFSCLAEGKPSILIGIGLAHLAALFMPGHFKDVRLRVTVGRRLGWGGLSLAEMLAASTEGGGPELPLPTEPDDLAAILFTSGSTGPAKGAVYTHAMFRAQIEAIREGLDIREGGFDLATFPLFGLFAPALGLTSVIPDINTAKPAQADPKKLVAPILKYGISSMFASPTLVGNMARHAREKNLTLPSLRRVIMAGAPARPSLVRDFSGLMSPEGSLQTPYGATEGVPLTTISGAEILGETGPATERGAGMCVGRPLAGVRLKIIKIDDGAIERLTDDLCLSVGEIGEIAAQGPMISPAYFERPLETALALMKSENGLWRRMGDVGYLDDEGRLWFCGRKDHRVVTSRGTLFSIPCEAVFNRHPQVRRSALVGLGPRGAQRPLIAVEPLNARGLNWPRLAEELWAMAKENPLTNDISAFMLCRAFPVDPRHNAKIDRQSIAPPPRSRA